MSKLIPTPSRKYYKAACRYPIQSRQTTKIFVDLSYALSPQGVGLSIAGSCARISARRQRWRNGLGNEILHQITDRATSPPAQRLKCFVNLPTQLKIETLGHPGRIQPPSVHGLLRIINQGSCSELGFLGKEIAVHPNPTIALHHSGSGARAEMATTQVLTHKGTKLATAAKCGRMCGIPQSALVMHLTKEGGTDDFVRNRTPQRVTITLNYAAFKGLERRSSIEGRSMSNLAAYILEKALANASESNT